METKRLFVGGLFKDVTEDTLKERFSKFGTVSNVEIKQKYDTSSSSGEWIRSFAFLDLQTTPQDFHKCVQVLGKTKWKGHALRIEEAGCDFFSKVRKDMHHDEEPVSVVPSPEQQKDTKLASMPAVVPTELRGATPGTVVPGVKNWVVTKFARAVPVVYIRRKDKKKVMKYDPSKHCHQLKKLEGKEANPVAEDTSVTSLTWSLPEAADARHKRQIAKGAAVQKNVASRPMAARSVGTDGEGSSSDSDPAAMSEQSSDTSDTDDNSDSAGDSDTKGGSALRPGLCRARTARGCKPNHKQSAFESLLPAANGHRHDFGDIEIVPVAKTALVATNDMEDSGADTDDILSAQRAQGAAKDMEDSGADTDDILSAQAVSNGNAILDYKDGSDSGTDTDNILSARKAEGSLARPTKGNLRISSRSVSAGIQQMPDNEPVHSKSVFPTGLSTEITASKLSTANQCLPAIAPQPKQEKAMLLSASGKASVAAALKNGDTVPAAVSHVANSCSKALESSQSEEEAAECGVARDGRPAADRRVPTRAKPVAALRIADTASRLTKQKSAKVISGLRSGSPVKLAVVAKPAEAKPVDKVIATDKIVSDVAASLELRKVKVAHERPVKECDGVKKDQNKLTDDSSAAAKHEISNRRRMETVKERQLQVKMQQQKIKDALKNLDSSSTPKSKHITFDSDSDANPGAVAAVQDNQKGASLTEQASSTAAALDAKKATLFGNDLEHESDEDAPFDKAFESKPQFEGKKGEKLMKLQSRFNNDERFRLTEMFMDDDSDQEGSTGSHEMEASDSEGESEKVTSTTEKDRNLSILREIVGDKRVRVFEAPKAKAVTVAPNMLMTRYDPTDKQHKSLELAVEPKKKKPKKSFLEEKTVETSALPSLAPEVSKERFFEVQESLAGLFAKKEAATFSFFEDVSSVAKPPTTAQEPFPIHSNGLLQATQPWARGYPEKLDSSDDDDGSEDPRVDGADWPLPPDKLTVGDSVHPVTALVDSFFFMKDDPRLLEGRQFCRRLPVEELREQWQRNKEELTQDYRMQRKRVLRKKRSKEESKPPWKKVPTVADRRQL